MTTKTKHTCSTNGFPRKTPGCPRCDELLAGHAPRPSWQQRAAGIRPRSMHSPQVIDAEVVGELIEVTPKKENWIDQTKKEMATTKKEFNSLSLHLEGLKAILKNNEKSRFSNIQIWKALKNTESRIAQIIVHYNTLKDSIS